LKEAALCWVPNSEPSTISLNDFLRDCKAQPGARYRLQATQVGPKNGSNTCSRSQRASRGGRPARNDLNLSSDLRDLPSSIEARSSTTALAIVMGTTSDCDCPTPPRETEICRSAGGSMRAPLMSLSTSVLAPFCAATARISRITGEGPRNESSHT